MGKRLLFIYNPKSGRGKIRSRLYDILDVFAAAGYEILIHPTQRNRDASETIIRYSEEVDLVVCSGGDGTLDEAVDGIMRSRPGLPIGYIPSGSTNDFGASLGISNNMLTAAQDIVRGDVVPCDIGTFNDKSFVYIAAFGLFTDVAYQTDQTMKNLLGHAAYLLEAGKRLFNVPSFRMHVTADDMEVDDSFVYGMITNARSVGGIRNLPGANVDMSDGLFEVRLVYPPGSPLELNEIISTLLNPKLKSKFVKSFKTRHLSIVSQEPMDWTLDGEFGGTFQDIEIENLHKALQIVLNQSRDNSREQCIYKKEKSS